MMNRSRTCWTLLALCAMALPQAAGAQTIASPYRFLEHGQYVGLTGGYVWADEGRVGNGPKPAPYLGAAWALRVSGPFAVAVDVGFIPTTRTVLDTVWVDSRSNFQSIGEADMSILTLLGGLRFNLPGARTWHNMQPFLVLSAGVALDLASGSALEEDLDVNARFDFGTSFAGQVGAGVDWFPTQRVSLRVDARNLLWKVPIPEALQLTTNGNDLPGSEWEQNFALLFGLSIHF